MTRKLILDPPRAAGPIALGMPTEEASAVLRTLEGFLEREPGTRPCFAHYVCGLSISICPNPGGLVDAVELYRPERDVTVRGRGPLGHRARPVAAFGRSTLPDDPDDPDGMYFESVLVAAPGYYDVPSATSEVHPS